MLKQLYGPQELARVIRPRDVKRWNLWEHDRERRAALLILSSRLAESNFEMSPLNTRVLRGRTVCEPSNPEDYLALRLADYYLRRIYKVQQSDRSRIVRQLKVILEDTTDLELRKVDIHDFYESIDLPALLSRIRSHMILGFQGVRILTSLWERSEDAGIKGLPRGIGISATLAEIVGRDIDNHIRNVPGVFYVCRYVDDIVVVSERRLSDLVNQSLGALWSELGLDVNPQKSMCASLDSEPQFSYLGYEFKILRPVGEHSPRSVEVRIAGAKLRKQKTRICRAFAQFARDGRFELLLARLRYISGNQLIARTENGLLYSGNAYNYREVTDLSCLDELDGLIRSVTSGKGRLGSKVLGKLSGDQITRVRRIRFRHAFEARLRMRFTRQRATRIKRGLK